MAAAGQHCVVWLSITQPARLLHDPAPVFSRISSNGTNLVTSPSCHSTCLRVLDFSHSDVRGVDETMDLGISCEPSGLISQDNFQNIDESFLECDFP